MLLLHVRKMSSSSPSHHRANFEVYLFSFRNSVSINFSRPSVYTHEDYVPHTDRFADVRDTHSDTRYGRRKKHKVYFIDTLHLIIIYVRLNETGENKINSHIYFFFYFYPFQLVRSSSPGHFTDDIR